MAGRPLLSEHVTNHGRKTFVVRTCNKPWQEDLCYQNM